MRFKIFLKATDKNLSEKRFPTDHSYYFSSWIYKLIERGNPEFSKWLHENGYSSQNRKFKLFTFSKLHVHHKEASKDFITFLSSSCDLEVSFYLPEIAEPFIKGIFFQNYFQIGNQQNKINFELTSIERLPDPAFNKVCMYNTLSPILITSGKPGDKHARYIEPFKEEYAAKFIDNLVNKYFAIATHVKSFSTLKLEVGVDSQLELLDEPKLTRIKIKPGRPEENEHIAWYYTFRLTAPTLLHEIGYHAGFGTKNSTGFGCCNIIRNNN